MTYSALSCKCSLKYSPIRIHFFMQTVIKTAHYELQTDLSTHTNIINELMPIFRSVSRGHMACYQFYVITKVCIRIHLYCLSLKRAGIRLSMEKK